MSVLDPARHPDESSRFVPREHQVEVVRHEAVYRDVNCGRCAVALTSAFGAEADGTWRDLNANDALRVTIGGGYGMLIDPRSGDLSPILLCKECARWQADEDPGIAELLVREDDSPY